LNEETGRDREDENEKAAGGVTFIDKVAIVGGKCSGQSRCSYSSVDSR